MIKKFSSADTSDSYTNKQWNATSDGKFEVIAGGLKQYKVDAKNKIVKLQIQEENTPLYMHPAKLAKLYEPLPFPKILSHKLNGNNSKIILSIEIPDKEFLHNTVYVYYGPEDGLTLYSEWPKEYKKCSDILTGNSEITLDYKEENKYYRLLVKDKAIQIWSERTYVIEA